MCVNHCVTFLAIKLPILILIWYFYFYEKGAIGLVWVVCIFFMTEKNMHKLDDIKCITICEIKQFGVFCEEDA